MPIVGGKVVGSTVAGSGGGGGFREYDVLPER